MLTNHGKKIPNAEETPSQRPTKSPPPKPTEEQASVRSPHWASGPPNSTEEQAIAGSTSLGQPNSVEEQASARSTPPQILGLEAPQIERLRLGRYRNPFQITLAEVIRIRSCISFSMILSFKPLLTIQTSMRTQNDMHQRIHSTVSELGIQQPKKKSKLSSVS